MTIQDQFLDFNLEDKVDHQAAGNDRNGGFIREIEELSERERGINET